MRLTKLHLLKVLLFSFISISLNSYSQKNNLIQNSKVVENKDDKDSIYAVVDIEPEFPGGKTALIVFIKQHLQYPDEAQKNHTEGKVNIQFVITRLGQVINAKVVKKVAPSLDDEALRIVNSFPNWIPGKLNRKDVSVYGLVQIVFKCIPNQNNENNWQASDSSLIVIDSLKLPLKFNLAAINSEEIDTGVVLKPFPEENRIKLIKQYGSFAKNGVIKLKTYSIKRFNNDTTNLNERDENYVYKEINQMPQFPGGKEKLWEHIFKNLKYPIRDLETGIQGKVIVRFVVNKKGKIINPKVIYNIEPQLDAEALRVIKSFPDWIPGEINGKKVNVYYTLPISFKIEGIQNQESANDGIEERNNVLIVLNGQKLPIGFNSKWLNPVECSFYRFLKPKNIDEEKQLIEVYGEDAANGVILINSRSANPLSKTSINNRIIPEQMDSLGKPIFEVVEQMPKFPGGDSEILKFISSNLKYPFVAQTHHIQGSVYVRFVVNSIGSIERVEVIRGLAPDCDSEVLRIIKLMPRWIPGIQNGQTVAVWYTLPIKFKLD